MCIRFLIIRRLLFPGTSIGLIALQEITLNAAKKRAAKESGPAALAAKKKREEEEQKAKQEASRAALKARAALWQ